MKIIPFKQRTPEWYEWRRAGIGASDIPVLTGNSPYTSKRELFLQKKGGGKEKVISDHVLKISNKVEEDGINYFKENKKIIFEPICVENEHESLLRASLDGWNQIEGILECKYISFDYFNDLKENKKIRLDHQDQMQFQMLITGHHIAHYYVQNTKGDNLILILKEDKNHQNNLKKLALDFLKELDIRLDYTE
jgi:putative phage-type endonuclease